MTSINLLHVLVLGCHHQGFFPNKAIKAQHANLVRHLLHCSNYSTECLKYIKFASLKSQCWDIKIVCLPFQLQFVAVYIFEPNILACRYSEFSTPVILHTYPPMKMEQTVCSEMLAYKIQTPGNYPEESIHVQYLYSVCSHSFSSLSYDRPKTSSRAIPPHSAI
jgi:hypothetical protein